MSMNSQAGVESARARATEPHLLEAVGQFSLGIAHDFNTLLTIIASNASILAETYPNESDVPCELKAVGHAAQRGAQMVRRLMLFARHQSVQLSTIGIDDVMVGMPEQIRALLPDNVSLESVVDRTPLLVTADSGVLEEILLNLATNARDAMPSGGSLVLSATRTFRCSATDVRGNVIPRGEYVEITVGDTGTGLDERTRERMFEPFFSTKHTGAGAGLGLAMSYALVRQLNGYMDVDSVQHVGTRVTLILPALPRLARAATRP